MKVQIPTGPDTPTPPSHRKNIPLKTFQMRLQLSETNLRSGRIECRDMCSEKWYVLLQFLIPYFMLAA